MIRRPFGPAAVAAAVLLAGVVSIGTYHILTRCGDRVVMSADPDDAAMGISHESVCHATLGGVGIDFDLSRPSRCTWSLFPPDQPEQWPSIDGNISYAQGAPVSKAFFAPAGHVHETMNPPIAVEDFNLACEPASGPSP